MAYDLTQLQSAKAQVLPPRAVLYAPPGVGKTTFGACAPGPIILPTEDGLAALKRLPFDVPAFPIAKDWASVMDALEALATQDHQFKTLTVDSLDWLEPIVWAETCRRNNWADIEAPGYGKGYLATLDVWRQFIDGLEYLRKERGMAYILLAHALVKRFDAPDAEPLRPLPDQAAPEGGGPGDGRRRHGAVRQLQNLHDHHGRGVQQEGAARRWLGERIMFTEERPAFVAKNRHGLPAEMEFTYEALSKFVEDAPVEEATGQWPQEGDEDNG
jgi:hypothetical protein